jgi:hypothetical protein
LKKRPVSKRLLDCAENLHQSLGVPATRVDRLDVAPVQLPSVRIDRFERLPTL